MPFLRLHTAALFCCLTLVAALSSAQTTPKHPWDNTALDPDTRAELMIHEMTLDEKIQLVHGIGWGVLRGGAAVPANDNGGAGMVVGIPRLGLPDIQLADSAVGARGAARDSRYATLLPSVIGMAASFDERAAHLYGQVIGRELRDQGYNMSIGGGMDLIREPRNGRNFEYASEDPLVSGILVGHLAMGVQSQHIMGDIKHYVLNDQETGRNTLNAILSPRAMQETDLLAFQIAIKLAKPAGVMCSYNRVNGDYACENDYTLNKVLKQDWGFQGFVLSDWDGTHSTANAANNGLDMEQPGIIYFGDKLKAAVQSGEVSTTRLDNMVHRIVRSMFAVGVIDNPPTPRRVTDPFQGRDDARHIESEAIVLLKNQGGILPLNPAKIHTIAIIGAHADIGVLSGGGSAQVDAPGGNALDHKPGGMPWNHEVYFPSVPLKAVQALAPNATITFNTGTDAAAAAAAAKSADIVLLFADQWMSEGMDRPTLALPHGQDEVIAAVAAANPHTIVLLETGGPVTMPWAPQVAGILETWYPGIGGAEAIADILFGRVNPSGKLPITFPASIDQLPHPKVPGLTVTTKNNGMNGAEANEEKNFPVDYNIEGMAVGYKWFQMKHETPLFPFGFGLSYTTFAYSNLQPMWHQDGSVANFDITNTGALPGDDIAQVYVTFTPTTGEPFRKLAAFQRIHLVPGETKHIKLPLNPLVTSTYSAEANAWTSQWPTMTIEVGDSSANLPLVATPPTIHIMK